MESILFFDLVAGVLFLIFAPRKLILWAIGIAGLAIAFGGEAGFGLVSTALIVGMFLFGLKRLIVWGRRTVRGA